MSIKVIETFENYEIQRVGWHGYRVVNTNKKPPYDQVSALYDQADGHKRCWDWLTHNVDEAIHYAPHWYIAATHDALGR